MTELDVGLAGGAKFLTEHFGRSAAREMYFTGRRVMADELYRRGVVQGGSDRRAIDAAGAGDGAHHCGQARSQFASSSVPSAWPRRCRPRKPYRFEQTVTVELSKTEDTKEAQRAFVEKRKPVFKGR